MATGGMSVENSADGTLKNFGTLTGRISVAYSADATLTNFGALTGGITADPAAYERALTLTNLGTVAASGAAVSMSGGDVVTNGSTLSTGALFTGKVGVRLEGGTVVNFGTIASKEGSAGDAVNSNAAGGELVVEPGAVFVGKVRGGGSSNLDFETAGVADMRNVSGFETITLGNGKSHALTVTGANFAKVAGQAITVDDGDSGNTVTGAALGAAARIIVHAGVGLDRLTGGKGNDVFFAGGDTVMRGGAGANEFTFSAPGGNRVADFAVSATNEIVFSNKGFSLNLSSAAGTPKALPAGLFVENSDGHFTNTSQRFAYATGSGDLFYSASGENGMPTLVSHFSGGPALAASQLFFIT
jgi:hypothetical protein